MMTYLECGDPSGGNYGERCLNIANGLFDRSQVTGLLLGGRDEH